MASDTVRTTYGIARSMVGLAVMTAALLLPMQELRSQQEPTRPMPTRAREALRLAIECYKRGDHENAALYFVQAQKGTQNLATSDQEDLKTFASLNDVALKGRQGGSAQLQQAEEAIKQGKRQEAVALLSALDANQYLSTLERQRVSELQRQMQTESANAGQQIKVDARTLLATGRAELLKGDYDRAESFASQAEKVSSVLPTWLQPWNDSPTKLRRDIEAAKTRQPVVLANIPKTDAEARDTSWMPSMKSWFGRTEKTDKPAAPGETTQRSVEPDVIKSTTTTSKFLSLLTFGQARKEPGGSSTEDVKANELLREGFVAMEGNDLERARQCAYQAKELRASYGANEPTPDALLHEIQRRAANPKVRAQSNVPTAPVGPLPNPAGPPSGPSGPPLGLVGTAQPEPGASQGKPTSVPVMPSVPNPTLQTQGNEALLTTPAPTAAKADPRALLREGRTLLQQKKYEEADKVCTQTLSAGGRWGLFEDTPEKLRRDIQRLRQSSDREQAARLMIEARKLYTQGNFEDAESKAYKAQQLHGPYGVFEFGDRPHKLLEEIQRTRGFRKDANPAHTGVKEGPNTKLPDGPNKVGPPPAIPVGQQNANKNRAIAMVRDARTLENQGKLSEARKKVMEARALKATFLPGEDSPDNVLLSLNGKCDQQIQNMLQGVTEIVSNTSDPQRFEKAPALLIVARQLAVEFGLDTSRIDQKAMWLQQSLAGTVPMNLPQRPNPAAPVETAQAQAKAQAQAQAQAQVSSLSPMQQQGRARLMHAQNELSAGKFAQARKMAEELFHPMYGLQEEVMRFIRTIDAEEYNQRVLEAKRTFDAGMEAFVQKNYKQALRLFHPLEPQLLPEQYQARLRDVMAMREMQPEAVMLLEYREKSRLTGTPITEGKPPTVPTPSASTSGATTPGSSAREGDEEDYLKRVKALEMVQYQALRQRGLEAQRTALELFKTKQKQEAISTLNQYLEQVQLAQLSSDKSADLRREAENRIQQFRMQMAQEDINAKEKQPSKYAMFHDEGKYQRDIQKHQNEIVKQMKEVTELMKQNKLAEAEVLVKKVRQIDPDNTAALAADFQIQNKRNQKSYDDDTHANERVFIKSLSTGLGEVADMEHPVLINRERVERRPQGTGEIWQKMRNPKERAIDYRLEQPISLHLKNVPLQEAIRTVAIESGVQVVPDMLALQQQNINLESPLSVSVENIKMKSALNILLMPMRLTYIIDNEVLMITTAEKTSGRLVRVTYPVTDLVILPESHPMPDVFNIQKALERTITPSGSSPYSFQQPAPYAYNPGVPVSSPSMSQGLGSAFGSSNPPGGAQNGLPGANYGPGPKDRSPEAMAEVLKELIMNTVHKNSWEAVGGQGSIQYFPMGMALVINQVQEVQEEILSLLASLRKLQDLQVAVEMRAVLVSETFFERIGVDFNMNIRTPTSNQEPSLVSGNFVPAPFINRTGAGLRGLVSGLTSAGTLTPDLNIPIRNNTFRFTTPQFGGYQPEAGLSLGLAFLSDIQVFMFLEAVQGDRRAHVMQAPKITVYNGQFATIGAFVARPQVTSVQPVATASGQVVMVPQVNTISFGLGMSVQPVVSPDRRFIRLNLTPQLASPVTDPAGAIVVAVPGNFAGTFDGGGAQPAFVNSPVQVTINPLPVSLTIANTTVNVPDGGTVLLGGFKFLAEERSEYGPPILSKIPYLSRLFRNVGWSRDGSTLMYLVTARIIMVEEEEQIFLGNQAPIPR